MTTTPRPIALVTGASRGIGRAIAVDLGRTHHVIVQGRDQGALDALAAELPSATTWAAELTGDGALDGFLAAGPDGSLTTLDVLVHSAGVIGGSTVEATSRDEWRRVLEVNVVAVAEITRVALPALRAARGTVIVINSGAGFTSRGDGGVYAASKFAVRAFADALRQEERAHGVRVSSVHPGQVDTDMQREIQDSRGNAYQADKYLGASDIADAVRMVVDLPPRAVAEVVSVRPLALG
ncbi:NADP-dependent 3-hydroxy acid dehydrogenase YdfG [Frondihabitans sp. PhB188]|uniref:SDR family oxidoreductase n=1 Tax=Frondihabitans sp. PhB188 TaxID=2485200 RepID=UPI000F47FADD|nr:SDR family oxidoreductase [Frondihabitans sp. PhB188]ROQ39464.1 NADP-dependent 3-hydroxy acid dehydrogenase YdfG [Frondihabitans sp. PhB188]